MSNEEAQQKWEKISEKITEKISKYAEFIDAMKTDELVHFMDACNTAYWLSINARTFEKKIDLQLSRFIDYD